MTEKKAAEKFWEYALSIYGRDATREAFLRLQDRDGADVPMLLWCLWCGSEGRGVTQEVMAEAVSFSDAWQESTVGPVRTIRRALKLGVEGIATDPTEDARGRIAQTEQALERMQMDHLAGLPSEGSASDAISLMTLYGSAAELSLDIGDLVIIAG